MIPKQIWLSGAGAAYLDVLDAFFDLFGSKVVVGHQVLALFDGLLQVAGSPAHLVFEGLVLTQQSQRSRQVLPMILGGQDLLLLPDPALLQNHRHVQVTSPQSKPAFSADGAAAQQRLTVLTQVRSEVT